jgi:hypothetical protein
LEDIDNSNEISSRPKKKTKIKSCYYKRRDRILLPFHKLRSHTAVTVSHERIAIPIGTVQSPGKFSIFSIFFSIWTLTTIDNGRLRRLRRDRRDDHWKELFTGGSGGRDVFQSTHSHRSGLSSRTTVSTSGGTATVFQDTESLSFHTNEKRIVHEMKS